MPLQPPVRGRLCTRMPFKLDTDCNIIQPQRCCWSATGPAGGGGAAADQPDAHKVPLAHQLRRQAPAAPARPGRPQPRRQRQHQVYCGRHRAACLGTCTVLALSFAQVVQSYELSPRSSSDAGFPASRPAKESSGRVSTKRFARTETPSQNCTAATTGGWTGWRRCRSCARWTSSASRTSGRTRRSSCCR